MFGRTFILSMTLLLTAALAGQATPTKVGKTAGKTYGEWSAAWWQWIFSFGNTGNPQFAEGEVDCSVNQRGPVWFLAGAQPGSTLARSCTVPASKALFFPVMNGIFNNVPPEELLVPEKRQLLEEFLSDTAPGFFVELGFPGTRVCQPRALLNGEPVAYENPMVRVQSPPFRIDSGDDPPFGLPPNLLDEESISDGFWVMLPPLAPGEHVLEFGGRFCEFDSFEDHPLAPPVNVQYQLTVVGHPSP